MEFLMISGIAILGMVAHWFKKHTRDETDYNLFHYMATNKRATCNALGSTFIAILVLFAHNPVDYTTLQGFALIFLCGYGGDSLANATDER